MRKGVVCLGEALIDFIPLNRDNVIMQKSPGGAPANVAVGIARLGGKSVFLGKVGNDSLGKFLKETLEENQVDVRYLYLSDAERTGVVFVSYDADGDRQFEFYNSKSADQYLQEDEIQEELFQKNKILHYGSISLIHEPAYSATQKAVALARKNGMLISFDPNIRLNLWGDAQRAKQVIWDQMKQVDLLKVSDEELCFLTGEEDLSQGIQALKNWNISLVAVTCGPKGSYLFFQDTQLYIPAHPVEVVDATGAGDAYMSAMLYCINEADQRLSELTIKEIESFGKVASQSGAFAVSKKGAMTALPYAKEIFGHK
ncbi:aminoimidazole riboside kinase [Thermoflavimicrobium dichotomicum]|nr:aminoimidazole riboside kinase [Thermoflavimicrobium dichotomicum]